MSKLDKQVRRLLTSPAGRASMKRQFGIDVEIVKDEKQLAEKPIVVTLCPTYSNPEAQMQDALGEMVRYTREKDFATIYSGAPLGSSVVHWSRNAMIQNHLNSGKPWTHVLFIDDDIVVEPDALERLLSHKKDIVAGLCTRRQDPPMPNIRLYDEETGKHEQIYEWPQGELIGDHKRLGVGTGLMLISKHALEQVAQAYFDCLWEQEFYGLTGERLKELKAARMDAFDKDKTCYWFRFLYPIPKLAVEMGEDMSFCFIARRYCDISVYVDTSVQPGHIGNYPFSIRDFLPHRDECVLRAKVNGHYPMEVPDMKISILCPTRGRPEQVRKMLASLRETSTIMPEVVFYSDWDDEETIGPSINPECISPEKIILIKGERIVMTDMWNKCAEKATGEILMQTGDDMLFKTKGWDDMVRRAFAAFPDRLVLVHGDDGAHGNRFSTHSFVHRAWVDAVGYFLPPYFSSDFGDTWLNDVFNAVNRRICLPFVTEHLHPMFGKGQWDKTHQERLERHKRDNPEELYKQMEPKRIADIKKVAARLNIPWEAQETILAAAD